jgi:hypothetical protein
MANADGSNISVGDGDAARFPQQDKPTAAHLSYSIVRWSKQICTSVYTQGNTTPNSFLHKQRNDGPLQNCFRPPPPPH